MKKSDIIREWIAWLRSGKQQAAGVLHQVGSDEVPDSYCCLGGLCEIATQHGVVATHPARNASGSVYADSLVGYGKADAGTLGIAFRSLPLVVLEWSGVTGPLGDTVTINGKVQSLSAHNDTGVPFGEIATAIEEQILPRLLSEELASPTMENEHDADHHRSSTNQQAVQATEVGSGGLQVGPE